MAVTVKIPAQLRTLTGNEAEAQVEGGSVGEALEAVYARYDGLRDRITENGELRRFVNVYVGGEDIRFGDGLETPVNDGDEITILPAVAGGCVSEVARVGAAASSLGRTARTAFEPVEPLAGARPTRGGGAPLPAAGRPSQGDTLDFVRARAAVDRAGHCASASCACSLSPAICADEIGRQGCGTRGPPAGTRAAAVHLPAAYARNAASRERPPPPPRRPASCAVPRENPPETVARPAARLRQQRSRFPKRWYSVPVGLRSPPRCLDGRPARTVAQQRVAGARRGSRRLSGWPGAA